MEQCVFPIGKKISFEELLLRLSSVEPCLGAIREFNEPDPSKRLHILVKDNIGLEGFTSPAGSKALEKLEVPDAFLVRKLKEAGCDVFGKTHMTELAGFVAYAPLKYGYSQLGGFLKNPHGSAFYPRGSSTGSAIAAAAGLCDAAIGTETNGSLMCPGLANGVFSFKPTRGTISRSGIVPLSTSLDTPGILARDIPTIREVFEILRGFDPEDPVTVEAANLKEDGPLPEKVGILTQKEDDPEIEETLKRVLEENGMKTASVQLRNPGSDYKEITSLEIHSAMDDFLAKHAKGDVPKSFEEMYRFYKEHPESHPFGMERLDDVWHYSKNREETKELFQKNERRMEEFINGLMKDAESDFLVLQNFADLWAISGWPSVTVPLGVGANGPYGIMIGARKGDDLRLLRLAERISEVWRRK